VRHRHARAKPLTQLWAGSRHAWGVAVGLGGGRAAVLSDDNRRALLAALALSLLALASLVFVAGVARAERARRS